jgi:hypothetical protein
VRSQSQKECHLLGCYCSVALVRTDVSEEPSTSILRVIRISELGTTLATDARCKEIQSASVASYGYVVLSSPILVTLMMEEIRSSETSILTRSTWRNIPEDGILYSYRCENLKSYNPRKSGSRCKLSPAERLDI